MKKNRNLKNNFSNIEFKTLSQLKNTVFKTINYKYINNPQKETPLISKKQLDKIFNKKTISKSKLKKYSYLKAYKKTFSFLEKNTNLDSDSLKKLTSRISNASLLKKQKQAIFDNWEFKDNKIFIQNYKNLLKINSIIEKNNYDVFRNSRILTNNLGQRFSFKEVIAPTKNYVSKIRSNLISIDADLLSYFANKKNLKKLEEVLTTRFKQESHWGRINTFNFDFTSIDFRASKDEIIRHINEVEANYYDKTGKYEFVNTRYFSWKLEYIESATYIIRDFSLRDDNSFKELIDYLETIYILGRDPIEIENMLKEEIVNDLNGYDNDLAQAFLGIWEHDYSIGDRLFEFEWQTLKQDMIKTAMMFKQHLQMIIKKWYKI